MLGNGHIGQSHWRATVDASVRALWAKARSAVNGDAEHQDVDEKEEFFDALEELTQSDEDSRVRSGSGSLDMSHPLAQEIALVCQAHWDNWGASTAGMELLEADGDLWVYRRRIDQGGLSMDPILATHTISGVTAHEAAEIFWNLQYRLGWENSLEQAPILLEALNPDTLLLHQIHKRVWPTDQRDSVFWSHIRRQGQKAMVVNCSTDYGAPPVQQGRQRIQMNVSLVCQTELPVGDGGELRAAERDQLRCRIQYTAQLSPGGSVPQAILRQVARHEYPRFLRKFATFCSHSFRLLPVQL